MARRRKPRTPKEVIDDAVAHGTKQEWFLISLAVFAVVVAVILGSMCYILEEWKLGGAAAVCVAAACGKAKFVRDIIIENKRIRQSEIEFNAPDGDQKVIGLLGINKPENHRETEEK